MLVLTTIASYWVSLSLAFAVLSTVSVVLIFQSTLLAKQISVCCILSFISQFTNWKCF